MSHSRRTAGAYSRLLLGLAVLLVPAALATSAQAAGYPERRITFVVGFAPGGGIDTFARVLAQALSAKYGWQIVVENRAGAASNIAARYVADAVAPGFRAVGIVLGPARYATAAEAKALPTTWARRLGHAREHPCFVQFEGVASER